MSSEIFSFDAQPLVVDRVADQDQRRQPGALVEVVDLLDQLLRGTDQLLVGRALQLVLRDPDHGPAGHQERHDRDRDREQQELGAKVEPHELAAPLDRA